MPATIRTAVFLAALGLAALTPAPGRAADLGGDCCADLEERVATLEATTVRKGNRKVSLFISGRVNANALWWDDHAAVLDADEPLDRASDLYFGNASSANETKVVLDGSGKVSSDLTAGFLMTLKYDFSGADSQIVRQGGPAVTTDTTYVFLKSARWGEYRLGNLPSASDDAYYVDFGSVGTVGGLYRSLMTGGFRLRAFGPDPGELTDVSYGHVLGELPDMNENRLMYISPSWNGFSYKSDIGTNTGSAALSWTGGMGSLRGAGAVGYQVSRAPDALSPGGGQSVQSASSATVALTDSTHDTLRILAMSASLLETKSGLFLTGEYSRAYADVPGRQDASNWFLRTGWTKDVTGMGATTLDAQYQRTDNKLTNNTSAHLWGIGIDQAIDSAASNIYLHYQHDSFDTSGVVTGAASASSPADSCLSDGPGSATNCTINAQSIDSLTAGMVINF